MPVFFTHVVVTETEIGTIINPDLLRRDPATFSDVYIVFEHMDMDLNKLGRDTKQSIGLDHVRWFMYEVSDDTCDLFEASYCRRKCVASSCCSGPGICGLVYSAAACELGNTRVHACVAPLSALVLGSFKKDYVL